MKYVSPLNAPGNCRVTKPALWDYYSWLRSRPEEGYTRHPSGGFNAAQIPLSFSPGLFTIGEFADLTLDWLTRSPRFYSLDSL